MRNVAALAACLLGLAPAAAWAQAQSCQVPAELPRPRPVLPRADEVRANVAVTGYTLALSWSPQYCRGRNDDTQCSGRVGRFGFILHGLWPEGSGRQWPQYCRPAQLLPPAVVRDNLCVTPSAQLMQHEWAKHGTCMTGEADAYFRSARALYQQLTWPDMARLARSGRTHAGALVTAFTRSNPGLKPEMVRVRTGRGGWLTEVWICLDRRLAWTRCPAGKGGVPGTAPLRIQPVP